MKLARSNVCKIQPRLHGDWLKNCLKPYQLFEMSRNGANEGDFLTFLIEAVILRGK